MNEFLVILGMAIVTFSVRYPPLASAGRISLPDPILKALGFVPVAVLTAIIVPAMLIPNAEDIDLSLGNPYLVAGFVSVLIAWRTKNLLLTIVLGMAIFLAWKFLVVPLI
jgi:branched-subunit amino acid transport protein